MLVLLIPPQLVPYYNEFFEELFLFVCVPSTQAELGMGSWYIFDTR